MSLSPEHIQTLRTLLEAMYPGWDGVQSPAFVSGEIAYKRATVAKAQELLDRAALTQLIEAGEYDEFLSRLETLGKDNNLLWRAVPTAGDLNILYQDDLDKPGFCRAFLDLLHGDGTGPARLGRYLRYIRRQELPDKWTFPTYFLFIYHPETELFVKPSTTKQFLALVDREELYESRPSDTIYEALLEIARKVRDAFADDGARDMVDAQSIMWTAAYAGAATNVTKGGIQHEEQLRRLVKECARDYPSTEAGQNHLEKYPEMRRTAAENFEDILRARERGEDVTDLVLLKLLPHADSASNRASGAWVTVAPAIQGDLKKWFQNAGWRDEGDWPQVADRILQFFERALEEPAGIMDHCKSFDRSKYSTGFQSGMLSPALSAIDPDQYLVINNKSRAVINYFLGTDFSPKLVDYPELNIAGRFLIHRLGDELDAIAERGIRRDEAFDMFAHWLVAEKKFSFGSRNYWKVSPGEGGNHWKVCEAGHYIGIGWDDLGDLRGISKDEFEERLAPLVEERDDWTAAGARQVWTFAKEIQEGDVIVANEGTKRVLGIGTVSGPYYYVEGGTFPHRLPVEWEDTTPREVNQGGWRSTLIRLDEETVDEIRELSPDKAEDHRPAFSQKTFELLSLLTEDPSKSVYDEQKDDFKAHVEEPLKELLGQVGSLLPNEMAEVLETERWIFSHIPKNDYGRGGAWDFFWGAFYPQGEKRISSAQLFAWLNRNVLQFGFYIGEYGSDQRKRFLRNVREHRAALKAVLPDYLEGRGLALGAPRGDDGRLVRDAASDSLDGWLEDLAEEEIQVSKEYAGAELLTIDQHQLREDILQTFKSLFPLILLASSDEPMKAIGDLTLDTGAEEELAEEYSLETCAADTGFDRAALEQWVEAIERKRQAILYGPPGTGKTFLAQKLADHLVGGGDGFSELVQFHPSYSYEEFIQGIRPETDEDGSLAYRLSEGRFLEFCRKARGRSGRCVLIVDEINRADLSRVFGELMYLLEYRDAEVPLAGGGHFRIPKHVRILGTMNTADRSIALVDHALRRRFAFLKLQPQYEVLQSFHEDRGLNVQPLIEKLAEINAQIGDPDFHLGITFFLHERLPDLLPGIWRMEIEPYIEELFFDDRSKIDAFRWEKVGEEVDLNQ